MFLALRKFGKQPNFCGHAVRHNTLITNTLWQKEQSRLFSVISLTGTQCFVPAQWHCGVGVIASCVAQVKQILDNFRDKLLFQCVVIHYGRVHVFDSKKVANC